MNEGSIPPDEVTPQWIREEHRAGRIKIIGELAPPYAGYSAGDPVYEPFFALAKELDISMQCTPDRREAPPRTTAFRSAGWSSIGRCVSKACCHAPPCARAIDA